MPAVWLGLTNGIFIYSCWNERAWKRNSPHSSRPKPIQRAKSAIQPDGSFLHSCFCTFETVRREQLLPTAVDF
jgi:hypothetical protein